METPTHLVDGSDVGHSKRRVGGGLNVNQLDLVATDLWGGGG